MKTTLTIISLSVLVLTGFGGRAPESADGWTKSGTALTKSCSLFYVQTVEEAYSCRKQILQERKQEIEQEFEENRRSEKEKQIQKDINAILNGERDAEIIRDLD
jgi:hypothetical protein